MLAGRRAVDLSFRGVRGYAHAAEERMQRDCDTGREERHHVFTIEVDDARVTLFEVFFEKARRRAEAVVRPRYRHRDLVDVEFENVTRLSAFDKDRPGKNMPARAARERLFGHRFGDGP